jgi:hypothetical protein
MKCKKCNKRKATAIIKSEEVCQRCFNLIKNPMPDSWMNRLAKKRGKYAKDSLKLKLGGKEN